MAGGHGCRRLPNTRLLDHSVVATLIWILLVTARPQGDAYRYIDHRAGALPLVEAIEALGGLVFFHAPALGEVETLLEEPALSLDPNSESSRAWPSPSLRGRRGETVARDRCALQCERRCATRPKCRGRLPRGARLGVSGDCDSMIEAGIVDGDLLFVIPTRELREAAKHIVICRVSGVTLAKELELHAGRIRLLSRNGRYAALDADEENFQLIGTVAGRLGSL